MISLGFQQVLTMFPATVLVAILTKFDVGVTLAGQRHRHDHRPAGLRQAHPAVLRLQLQLYHRGRHDHEPVCQ